MKKLTSLILTFIFFVGFSLPSYAISPILNNDLILTDDVLTINADMAEEIAKLFLADALCLPDVNWTSSTEVIETIPLYDGAENAKITSYSVELTEGYIIVSAYVDVPSMILEWSDQASPVYAEFTIAENDKIVYTNPLQYYKDSGGSKLETIDQNFVDRESVENNINSLRDITNISPALLTTLTPNNSSSTYGYISDPIVNANLNYNGPFVANDWENNWEDDVMFYTTSDFKNLGSGYNNHCGPTAITNMLIAYGNRKNTMSILSTNTNNIFVSVAELGLESLYYSQSTGTSGSYADDYIIDSFDLYGVDISVLGRYSITYTNVKNSFEDNNLLYITLNNDDTYGDHAVVGYAYTRLRSQTDGSYVTYVKIADGHNDAARYIDLNLLDSTSKYWELIYN